MIATKIIIDTDPGIDDAMALFYAVANPAIDLLGLTTVFGNVRTSQATRNALFLMEEIVINLPVAPGLHKPRVLPPFPPSAAVHGEEGFGSLLEISPRNSPCVELAPEFLVRMAQENKGEITLCPIGPLTNVAAAIDLDPDFCKNLKNIIIMGGSLRTGGNITPAAEANIYHDPHAADFVFENGSNITMVGLDVTDRVVCSREYFKALALESPQIGSLLNQMADFYITFYESISKINGCGMHDPTALIKCAEPSFFKTEAHKIKVILSGERMGETISDLNLKRPNIEICVDVDISAVKDDFFSNVAKLK